jgi:hypothetical protein
VRFICLKLFILKYDLAMVTKEQCLLKKIYYLIELSNNDGLVNAVLNAYNSGKRYASDMIFKNDENGLDQALVGYSPSFIVYSLIGDNSNYDPEDPFFVVDSGIRSIDGFDLEGMIGRDGVNKILNSDVLECLEDSDCYEAFEDFVQENYPEVYRNLDYDALDGYNSYDFLSKDWNAIVKQLTHQVNEKRTTVRLNENDIKGLTNSIVKEILKRKK